MHDVVAPGEVAVELAARARCAGHHHFAVPVIRKPDQDSRFTQRIICDAGLNLDARHRLGDGRAKTGRGCDHAAISLRRECERWQPGQGVIGRRGGRIGGREICALKAGCVGDPGFEQLQQAIASRGGGAGYVAGGEDRQGDDVQQEQMRTIHLSPPRVHFRRTRRADLGVSIYNNGRSAVKVWSGQHTLNRALASPVDHRTHPEHVPEPAVEGREVAKAGLKRDRRNRLR